MVVKNIRGLVGQKQSDYMFSFLSQSAPKVKSIDPPDGSTDMSLDRQVVIILDSPVSDFVQYDFEFDPPTEFEVTTGVDQYTLTAKERLKVGMNYNLKIYQTLMSVNYQTGERSPAGPKEEIKSTGFRTVDSHQIKSYSPNGSDILIDPRSS